jgi:surface antigen
MQSDGNLVVYTPGGTPVFATGTAWSGSQLIIQSDSNVVLYTGSTPLWASNSHLYSGQATRTRNAGDPGNCTQYAYDRWYSFWGRHLYPAFTGNAINWDDSARALHYQVSSTPATQALVVFNTGQDGHVAWVDAMRPLSNGGIEIHIWELNRDNNPAVRDEGNRWVQVASNMSFIMVPAI